MLPPGKLLTRYRRWRQRNPLHKRPSVWVVAVALAIGGAVWYVLSPTGSSWWIGTALILPLLLLVMARGRRFPSASNDPGSVDGGPWGPP